MTLRTLSLRPTSSSRAAGPPADELARLQQRTQPGTVHEAHVGQVHLEQLRRLALQPLRADVRGEILGLGEVEVAAPTAHEPLVRAAVELRLGRLGGLFDLEERARLFLVLRHRQQAVEFHGGNHPPHAGGGTQHDQAAPGFLGLVERLEQQAQAGAVHEGDFRRVEPDVGLTRLRKGFRHLARADPGGVDAADPGVDHRAGGMGKDFRGFLRGRRADLHRLLLAVQRAEKEKEIVCVPAQQAARLLHKR